MIARPANCYRFDQLAMIYNQTRADYIVPMAMDGKRMADYVRYYDIDLAASCVVLNDKQAETGVGMLGLRGDRGWITRLGVIPEQRSSKAGQFVVERLIEGAQERGVKRMQLEVISGNQPAYRLFRKLGFKEVRELVVMQRLPGRPAFHPAFEKYQVTEIFDIAAHLEKRSDTPSWIDENQSLLNAGNLRGIKLADGEQGWVIFQYSPSQLSHFAFSPTIRTAVLYHLHRRFPAQEMNIENLAADHPSLAMFWEAGYIEMFRRMEMVLGG